MKHRPGFTGPIAWAEWRLFGEGFPELLRTDATRARVCADARGELARVPVHHLPFLDRDLRAALQRPGPRYGRWPLSPGAVRHLDLPAADGWALLAWFCMHPDGRVRQAAVERLASLPGPDVVPFLALRANDWADPAREAAVRAVLARLDPEQAPGLARAMPLLWRARQQWRGSRAWVARMHAYVTSPEGLPALLAALDDPEPETRQVMLRWADEADLAVQEAVLRKGAEHPDPGVRWRILWSARRVPEAVRARVGLPDRLLADPHDKVRMSAMAWMAERGAAAAFGAAKKALLAPTAYVRRRAQRIMAGRLNLASYYHTDARARGPRAIVAVEGLAETAPPGDPRLAAIARTHAAPAVRARAFAMLVRGPGADPLRWSLRQAADRAPSVVSQGLARLDRILRRARVAPLDEAERAELRRDLREAAAALGEERRAAVERLLGDG
jgi:hypothetical protein